MKSYKLILGVLPCLAYGLNAQTVDLKTYTIFADRLAPGEDELPASSIQVHKPIDLAEVLASELPEASLIRKAGAGNDLSYRGFSQDNLSVLNDGRKIFCACANRMDPPAAHIGSELVSAMRLQGGLFDLSRSGALAATVSVSSREPTPGQHLAWTATVGDYGYRSFTGIANGGSETFRVLGAYTRLSGDPYEDGSGVSLLEFPDNTAWPIDDYQASWRDAASFESEKALVHGLWQPAEAHQLDLTFSYDYSTDVLYPGLFMDSEFNKTRQLGLRWTSDAATVLWDSFEVDAYTNQVDHLMTDTRRLSALQTPMGASRPSYVLERGYYMLTDATAGVDSITFEALKENEASEFRYGMEWLNRFWDSDNRLGAGMPQSGLSMEIFNNMIPNVNADTLGGFFQVDYHVNDNTVFGGGIRIDRFTTHPTADASFLQEQRGLGDLKREDTELSASIYERQRLAEGFDWFWGVGQTVRAPNPQERYINLRKPGAMANWLGNPDLDPVTNREFDLGCEWTRDAFSWRMKGFYSDVDGYILPVKLTPVDIPTLSKACQSYGQVDAEIYGADMEMKYRIGEHWSVSSGVAWQRGRKTDEAPGISRGDLAEMPPLKGNLKLRYAADDWEASWLTTWADNQDRVDEEVGEYPVSGYVVHRLSLSYNFRKSLRLSLIVDNVFDKTYAVNNAYVRNPFSNYALIHEPGRWAMLTLRWSWSND